MFKVEDKGLIVRTKLFLSFIAVAMGRKKAEACLPAGLRLAHKFQLNK